MSDDIILLLSDGTTGIMKKDRLKGKLKKVIPKDLVYAILVPVGIYSPQYVMFKYDDLIDNFISAKISYQMTIYDVGPLTIISDEMPEIKPVSIKCECLPDLYLSLHSLCKLDGFNMLYSSTNKSKSLLSRTPMPRISNLFLSINTKDGTSILNLSETKHWTQKIDKFFDKKFNTNACLPEYAYGYRVYIDTSRGIWQIRGSDDNGRYVKGSDEITSSDCNPKTSSKNILQSAGLIRYNCMTFIHPSDIPLLSKYTGLISIVTFNNMEMLENIDLGGPVDYYSLMDHPNYFSIISDSEYKLFTPSDIVEAVMTLRHTLMTWQVVNKFITGDDNTSTYDDANIMISIILQHENNSQLVKPFTYDVSIVEHEDFYVDDYYDDFITQLKKYEETIS